MDIMDDIVLEDKDILRSAIRERNTTQKELGSKIGMSQTALSGNLTRDRMSLDNFKRMLNALDYDVAVIDRETGEVRWVVDPTK